MKNRSPAAVFLLGFITLGIYSWYWAIKTKTEMNAMGNDIPTAWIWLIPIVGSIWWYWKYCEAVENVTAGKMNGVVAFLLVYVLGLIGQAIIQDSFNRVAPATDNFAGTPVASAMPTTAFTPETQIPSEPGFPTEQAPTLPAEPALPVENPTLPQPPTNPQPPTLVQ